MKKVRKAIIMARLRDKYDLQDIELAELLLDETIQLIDDVGELIKHSKNVDSGTKTPGSTGTYTLLTVPDGKKWTIRSYYCWRPTGASLTFNSFGIVDTSEGNLLTYMETFTAVDTRASCLSGQKITAEEGDYIQVMIPALTAGDTIRMVAHIEEEDAF